MRVSPDVLPRALQGTACEIGLEYLTRFAGQIGAYPVACRSLPNFPDPAASISALPLQPNFAREILDMDKPEDAEEYNRIMSYDQAGYGMRIVYKERRFVTKTYQSGGKKKRRIVQRIFIEYYAPYRVLTDASLEQVEPTL
jgi:hypothetical protein